MLAIYLISISYEFDVLVARKFLIASHLTALCTVHCVFCPHVKVLGFCWTFKRKLPPGQGHAYRPGQTVLQLLMELHGARLRHDNVCIKAVGHNFFNCKCARNRLQAFKLVEQLRSDSLLHCWTHLAVGLCPSVP